jgi:hypothetical protein
LEASLGESVERVEQYQRVVDPPVRDPIDGKERNARKEDDEADPVTEEYTADRRKWSIVAESNPSLTVLVNPRSPRL